MYMKKINLVCLVLLQLFVFVALGSCGSGQKLTVKTISVETKSGATVKIACEMAVTQEEQAFGFMERKKIPDGTGMLFVYNYDHVMHFWMKNTPSPLSIAYIDSKGIIKEIFDMTPYSLSDVSGSGSTRYALEVPQGYFQRAGISCGDRMVLDF